MYFFAWIILIVIFLIAEAISLNLTAIWFGFGAILGMLTSIFTDNVIIQILVFTAGTVLFIIYLKPISKNYLSKKRVATNADRVIGMHAVVTSQINREEGEVKVDGQHWSARGDSEEKVFEKGGLVEILKIEGVKLIVTEIKKND